MATARGTLQSSELIDLQLLHEISLHVQPESVTIENVSVVRVVFLLSLPKYVVLKDDVYRTTAQFDEACRLLSSVPTSMLFDFQYNKSEFSVSYVTLLLLTQILECCVDRLKSQLFEEISPAKLLAAKRTLAKGSNVSFGEIRTTKLIDV